MKMEMIQKISKKRKRKNPINRNRMMKLQMIDYTLNKSKRL
jgi:hypothetical protein